MSFDISLEERSVASIRAAVADTFRKSGNKEFQTIERIEDYSCNNDVADLPAAGTVFAAIADALEDTGVFGDYSTVGEVIKKLIGQGQHNDIKWIAHHLGCSCLGLVTGETVAGAPPRMIRAPASTVPPVNSMLPTPTASMGPPDQFLHMEQWQP